MYIIIDNQRKGDEKKSSYNKYPYRESETVKTDRGKV